MGDDFISASEISEYLYCQRAWWYRLRGFSSNQQPAMNEGIAQHQIIAQEIEQVEKRSSYAWRLILLGVALFIVILLLRFLVK